MSAAIHIHVILADINREDERFLLDARLHPPVLLTCEREGNFSTSVVEGGQDVWPHHSATLSGDLSILSGRFRKPFKFVFAVHTDLHDEDKCPLSMHTFIYLKLLRVPSVRKVVLPGILPPAELILLCELYAQLPRAVGQINERRLQTVMQVSLVTLYTLPIIYYVYYLEHQKQTRQQLTHVLVLTPKGNPCR